MVDMNIYKKSNKFTFLKVTGTSRSKSGSHSHAGEERQKCLILFSAQIRREQEVKQ